MGRRWGCPKSPFTSSRAESRDDLSRRKTTCFDFAQHEDYRQNSTLDSPTPFLKPILKGCNYFSSEIVKADEMCHSRGGFKMKQYRCLGMSLFLLFMSGCGPQSPRSIDEGKGWIGVYVQDLDRELRKYLDISERSGTMVNEIVPGSPADEAGLLEEDVITKFDGKRIRDTGDLTRAVQRTRPDEKVEVEVVRGREKKTLEITVGERRTRYSERLSRRGRAWLGVSLAELNNELAEYFQVNKDEGVLILEVEKDSPAEKAGLKSGDVILELGGKKVGNVDDVHSAIAEKKSGEEIEILYKRHGKTDSVKVELVRSPHSFEFHFDKDGLRAWKDELKEWKGDLKDWKHRFDRRELDTIDENIRIRIEDEIRRNIDDELRRHEVEWRDLDENIASEMEKLSRDLEREMENLNEELQKINHEVSL
jgi:hypothetical protein